MDPKPYLNVRHTGQRVSPGLVTTEQPLVTTEQPLVTTEQPLVTTEQPLVTTEQPAADNKFEEVYEIEGIYNIIYIYLNIDRLSKIVGNFWGISAQPLVDFGQLFVDFIKRALDFSPSRVDLWTVFGPIFDVLFIIRGFMSLLGMVVFQVCVVDHMQSGPKSTHIGAKSQNVEKLLPGR
jgi:hypothetical protein